jgi:hypothetical protein
MALVGIQWRDLVHWTTSLVLLFAQMECKRGFPPDTSRAIYKIESISSSSSMVVVFSRSVVVFLKRGPLEVLVRMETSIGD